MTEPYTPSTDEIRAFATRLGGWRPDAFDRWLNTVKAEVWDMAYQAGAEDTLVSPRDARENPYRT